MPAFTNELISSALKQSLKKTKYQSILTSDTRPTSADNNILNTEIEFEEHVGYSADVSNVLKSKYIVLKPNKSEFCTKCQSNSIAMKQLSESVEKENVNFKLPSPQVVLFPPEDVEVGWKSTVPVGSGFINQGTTCYINSTLQALFHIPSFVNWLTNDRKHMLACEKKNGVFHNECMVCAMMNTLNASHKATGNSIRPRFIVDKIKLICKHLSACRQEDAHEFLRYLMEAVERSYLAILVINPKKLDNYSKETTPLNQIFGGYIRTEVTCLECKHMSTTFQHFQDIILDIRQSSSVVDALENYFSEERLDVDDAAYHCDQCKKKVAARKKYSIEKAPNVLCIQLKRFNAHSLFGGGKLSKMISIEQYVDLKKFKHKSASSQVLLDYRLVSMVFHHGPSANSGHYSALGYTSTGSYYYFNDEQVCPAVFSSYSNSQNAYIIFYEINNKSASLSNKNNNVKKDASFHPNAVRNGYHNGNMQFQKDNTANTFPSRHSVLPFSKTYDRPYCSVLPQKEVKTYTVNPKKSNNSLFNGSNKNHEKSTPTNSAAVVTSSTVNDNSRYNAVIVATDVEKTKPSSQQLALRKLVPYNASDSSSSSDENDDINNNNGTVNNHKTSAEEIGSVESLQKETKKREGSLDDSSTTESNQTQSSKFTHCVNIIAALNSAPLNQLPFNDDLVMMPLTDDNFSDSNNNVNDVTKGTDTKADHEITDSSSAAEPKDVLPSTSKNNSTPLLNNKFFLGVNFSEVNGKSPRKCERSLNITVATDNNAGDADGSSSDSDGNDSNGWSRFNIDDINVPTEPCNTDKDKDRVGRDLPIENNVNDWSAKKSRLSVEKKGGEHIFIANNNATDSFSLSTSSKLLNSITSKQNAGCSTDGQISTNSGAFGYGVKVCTWNGGLSYISQETEKEHVESSRSGSVYSYNDEIDRGKIKKRAHSTINTDRVEHNGIKANPIQQYHNNLNNNINKNGTNNCNNINSNSSSNINSSSSNSNSNNINENNINNNKRHYINWNNGKKSNYFAKNHRNHFFNKHNKYPKYINNHNHRYNRYIHRHRPYWRN